jgi:hypothetical protein
VGKSFVAGVAASWWIDVRPPGEAFVVSTAPTYAQVHAILWEEIRKQHRAGDLPGRVLQSDVWKLGDDTIVGWGRKPADTDEHGFQGIHRRYVLVIIDEACGVPEQLWTAVEAITTNADCRILAIGNPDDPATEFGRVCKPGSGWSVIGISAFDSPNFTGETVPELIKPLLLDPEWVEDKRLRWGEDSPRYQSVARFGTDRTIIGKAFGQVFRIVGDYAKQATTDTTGRVLAIAKDEPLEAIKVDGVGVGGGVVDMLAATGVPVVDMQSGRAALDSERFKNARAEWWWGLRQRFEAGDVDLDPHDDELAAQLGAIKYKFTARGQVQIESKDDMRKRGMPSPDRADAMMLAYGRVPERGIVEPDEFAEYDALGWSVVPSY